jgi:outer membrane autotransporter protein
MKKNNLWKLLVTTITTILLFLEPYPLSAALSIEGGSQYPQLLLTTELSTHQFVRHLYDPVRTFLADDICEMSCECCECDHDIKLWVESGGGHSLFKSSCRAHGCKNNGFQVFAGAHVASCYNWLAGAALTYDHTNTHFNGGGSGNTNTVLGGLYGAYRFKDFYFLGDVVFGGGQSKVKRDFFVGDIEYFESGKPEALQGIVYAEFGKEFRFSLLVLQPFVGIEGGYFSYKHFRESGDLPMSLDINKRSYGTFDTRLGFHCIFDKLICGFFLGVDLAWQYRVTELNNYRVGTFGEFGEEFCLRGSHLDANSFEAAVNLEQKIGDNWSIYATGNWQQWSNAYVYDILGGVAFLW